VIDRRLLVAICAALVALASGVFALALDVPVLGLVAGTGAVVAAAAAAVLTTRLRVANGPGRPFPPGSPDAMVSLDLAALEAQAVGAEEQADVRDPFDGPVIPESSYRAHPAHGGQADFGDEPAPPEPAGEETPTVGARAEAANDPVSGLLGSPYFFAALDRGVASARRQLQPLSLVLFELDGLNDASDSEVDGSIEVLGAVLRRTLRECDTACRTGRTTAAVLLEDTPETGAVWAAERVRGGLLARPGGEHLTVSAGVASYPSHALDATDLLQRAERALASARLQGRDRVEIARAD